MGNGAGWDWPKMRARELAIFSPSPDDSSGLVLFYQPFYASGHNLNRMKKEQTSQNSLSSKFKIKVNGITNIEQGMSNVQLYK